MPVGGKIVYMQFYIVVTINGVQLASLTPPSMGVTLQSVYKGVVYLAFTPLATMV